MKTQLRIANVQYWGADSYEPANERICEFVHIPAGEFIYGPEVTYERLKLAPPPHIACNCRSACSITISSVKYRAQGTGFRVIVVNEG